ncbi:MAG TPA: hypothetical protein VFQ90_12600 [Stellaceae bacterium]|nr:hypothetical protein [Stellaceae bacterium]
MRALFECRLEHIGRYDRVKVECACGREVLLSLEAFAGLPSNTRIVGGEPLAGRAAQPSARQGT